MRQEGMRESGSGGPDLIGSNPDSTRSDPIQSEPIFPPIFPPDPARQECMSECAQLEDFDEQLYKVSGEGCAPLSCAE